MKMLSVLRIGSIIFCFTILTLSRSQLNRVFAAPAPFQQGDIFAGIGNGLVQHYNANGNLLETLDTGKGVTIFTTGCAFDSAGNLYVTTLNANDVVRFSGPDAPHSTSSFGTGYNGSPESIIFDANGSVYVGTVGGDNDVRKFDPTGLPVAQFDVTTENVGSDWIDITTNQRTLFYTSEGRRILRYDISGSGSQLNDFAVLPGSDEAFALRLLPPGDGSGGLLVADASDIKRLDGNGTVIQTYDVPGEDTWFSLNLDPDGTSFWAGNIGTGKFYKFDIATGGNPLLTVDTGVGADHLYGICVFGEKTQAVADTDGDGIPDNIEDNGYDALDRNGNRVHVNLPGANKNRKDIYVYIDWLGRLLDHDHKPDQAAMDKVMQAFANAPVDCDSSGQNCKGINLHVTIAANGIVETTGANGNQDMGSYSSGCSYSWGGFDTIKAMSFPKEFLPAYHYVIFGHRIPGCGNNGGPVGKSRGDGASDLVIGLGDWEPKPHLPGTLTKGRAVVFMHELGHNLGLGHGGLILSPDEKSVIGPDDTNYKPNYLSVMNYSFSGGRDNGIFGPSSWGLRKRCQIFFFCDGNLDYSRFGKDVLPDLKESDLSETAGLATQSAPRGNEVKDYGSRYFCNPTTGFTDPRPIEPIDLIVDWNCDRFIELSNVSADINQENGPTETFRTVNEWPHLKYRGGAIGAFGPSIQLPQETAEEEQITVESLIANSDRDALLISLVVDQNAVASGGTVVFTTRVASNTGTDITGVVISDTLPSGFTYQPGSTTGATTSDPVIVGQTLVYPGPFTVGANDILTLSFKGTSSSTPGTYLSSAQTSGTNAPKVGTGDTAPITVQAAPSTKADLSITKTDSPDPVNAGNTLTYNLTVTNNGPDSAENVVLTDNLPGGVTFISANPGAPTCTEASNIINCNLGNLASGSSTTVTVVVATSSSTPASIINHASVTANTSDPNTGNNSATTTTTVTFVVGVPDLTIAKTHSGNFTQGQTGATYTIRVANGGTGSSSGTVMVVDTLPSGLTATALSGTGWTCTLGTLICTRNDVLAAGSSYEDITLTVAVASNTPSSVSNSATVSGGNDANTTNNTANDPTTIGTQSHQTLRQQVKAVRDTLAGLLPSADKKTKSSLQKVIAKLDKGLANELWQMDGNHLTAQGETVYHRLNDAVKELVTIKNPSPTVMNAITTLVNVSRMLAQTTLNEATAAHGNPVKLAKAQSELNKGDKDRTKGKFASAIAHYEEAWEYVQQAVGHAIIAADDATDPAYVPEADPEDTTQPNTIFLPLISR